MKIIDKWKDSIEPCVRLLFVAAGVNIIIIPIAAFQSEVIIEELRIILSIAYALTVLPYFTAKWIRVCGFELNKKKTEGGMNEAAQAKQESLNLETKG